VYHIFAILEKKPTSGIIPVHLTIVKKKKNKNKKKNKKKKNRPPTSNIGKISLRTR
jgi:hypothetical protein